MSGNGAGAGDVTDSALLKAVGVGVFPVAIRLQPSPSGLLPVALPMEAIESLAGVEGPITVDLPAQQVRGGGLAFSFTIEPARKTVLLEGLDEIKRTEANLADIAKYEARRRSEAPWLEIRTS